MHPFHFPSLFKIISGFIYFGSFWLIFSLVSRTLKHLSSRNSASCIPPSDLFLEISQFQINPLDRKLALPGWLDGWLMSLLLPPPQIWQPESLSFITSLTHSSFPPPVRNSQPMCAWDAWTARQSRCADVTHRVPTTLTLCPSSPSLCCCVQGQTISSHSFWEKARVLIQRAYRASPVSEFGSSITSGHYHWS